jgi:hypothetical protein
VLAQPANTETTLVEATDVNKQFPSGVRIQSPEQFGDMPVFP